MYESEHLVLFFYLDRKINWKKMYMSEKVKNSVSKNGLLRTLVWLKELGFRKLEMYAHPYFGGRPPIS